MESEGGGCSLKRIFPAPQLQVLPPSGMPLPHGFCNQRGTKSSRSISRFTFVGERQANAPFSRQPAINLHYRQGGCGVLVAASAEIHRRESVSLSHYPGPRGVMEKRDFRLLGDQTVPTWGGKGVFQVDGKCRCLGV